MNLKKYVILMSAVLLFLGGCSTNLQVSAEEIIHNAMEADETVATYKTKGEMKSFEGDELVDHLTIEENKDGDKIKIVTEDLINNQMSEALRDGDTIVSYDQASGQAFEIDLEAEVSEIGNLSPKEQMKNLLKMVEDTHTKELVGEEDMLDYDTYHIKLTANDANSLFGDIELWIEQKTWFVVKSLSVFGEMKMETTYSELDFSPTFDDDTFTLDIPSDVEIDTLDGAEFGPNDVTLTEVEEALGQPILLFPEDEWVLDSVAMYDYSEGLDRYEVELNYLSEEGIPMVLVSVFPTPEGMEITDSNETVRGNPAQYEEIINGYTWDEDGLRYSLLLMNPDLNQDDVLQLTEEMVLSSKK